MNGVEADTETMTAILADVLGAIAPEIDLQRLDPQQDLQRQADLDSMDYLSLLEGLGARLGIDIPEADYAQLATPEGAVAYLVRRCSAGPGARP